MAKLGSKEVKPEQIAPPVTNASDTKKSASGMVKSRVLFGWLMPEEVQQYFANVASDPEEFKRLVQMHQQMIQTVSSRPIYKPDSPIVDDKGRWGDLVELAQRPELKALFDTSSWQIAAVDLRKIIAFQGLVKLQGLAERVALAATNDKSLLDLCISLDDPELPLTHNVDLDGKAFTISSPNPNFKILDARIGDMDKSAAPGMLPFRTKAISILVGTMPSHLLVVEYKGRYYLRDGYHRAVGLLRAKVHEVPCILMAAQNAEQIAPPGHLRQELFMGEQPPLLSDFLDDTVSGDGLMAEQLKVIRVRGEEFAVSS